MSQTDSFSFAINNICSPMSEIALQIIRRTKKQRLKLLDLGKTGLYRIPDSLYGCSQIETLILSNVYWNFITKDWGESRNRGKVNLSIDFSNEINRLVSLKTLIVSGNLLYRWKFNTHNKITRLPRLEYLDISKNKQLKKISFLASLRRLKILNLRSNPQIKKYDVLQKIPHLKVLDLNGNNIRDTTFLNNLRELEYLDISNNPYLRDFDFFKNLPNLKTLILSNNQLKNVDFLERLVGLEYLDLSKNQLSNTFFLKKLVNLKELRLDDNLLGETPYFYQLRDLEYLDLSKNQIELWRMPKVFGKLKYLDLSQNFIKELHWDFSNIPIEILDLSYNRIRDIQFLEKIQTLRSLNLSCNGRIKDFTLLKEQIQLISLGLRRAKLKNIDFITNYRLLRRLDISNNRIKDIKSLVPLLKKKNAFVEFRVKKRYFHREREYPFKAILTHNPIASPPVEIVEQNAESIVNYFEQLEKEKKVELQPYINHSIKLILVGNSDVGKTSVAKFLMEEEDCLSHSSTHWMEVYNWQSPFKIKNVDGNEDACEIRIFDFGGQEYYHDTHHLFFTNNTIYVLLWDKKGNRMERTNIMQKKPNTNKLIPVTIQNFPLPYWLEAIEHYTRTRVSPSQKQENKILVVQNKIDRDGKISLPEDILTNQFNSIHDFISISIKEQRRVRDLKRGVEEIVNIIPILGSQLLGSTGIIKKAIQNLKEADKSILSLSEFQEFCNNSLRNDPQLVGKNVESILFDAAYTKTFALYLSQIGLILYYPKNPQLNNTVFINLPWLTDQIYWLLIDLNEKEGMFNIEYVKETCTNLDDTQRFSILKVLEQFKVIYPHPGKENSYIAPLYLPIEPPADIKLFVGMYKVNIPVYRIQYKGFIHKSVILHFFQEYGQQVLLSINEEEEGVYFWRYGIVLTTKDKKEYVYTNFNLGSDEGMAYIDIYQHGKDYLEGTLTWEVIELLEKINELWNTTSLVTTDGENYVPVEKVRNTHLAGKNQFVYDEQIFEMKNFDKYIFESTPVREEEKEKDDKVGEAKKVLVLSSNPKDTKVIRIAPELKSIRKSLDRAKYRSNYELLVRHAIDKDDLRNYMLDFSPSIVHFSGHGSRFGKLLVEDGMGNKTPLNQKALTNFFKLFKDETECVILNACYSSEQAKSISKYIPYVVGMKSAMPNESAIKFSQAFYDSIFSGKNYKHAYEIACNAIEMSGLEGELIPVLLCMNVQNENH